MRALLAVLLCLGAGVCMSVQTGINAVLAQYLGTSPSQPNPIGAAFVSFLVGTVVLAALVLALRLPLPIAQAAGAAPLWIWIGGSLGAFLVSTAVFAAPILGAGTLLSIIVFSQMAAAVVLDHYGLLGYPQTPISWQRILGVVLLVTGVVLMRR